MPTANIEGPQIDDLDKKRELTRAVTDAMEKYYGLPRDVYVVVIKENPPQNVSSGGELIIDRIARVKAEAAGS
jgi:4-oxalocrotonate tautomerase family enzyme